MEEKAAREKKVLRVKKRKHTKKYYFVEGVRRTVMMIALFVFSYVAYELTNIYLDYKEAGNAYADVNEMLGGNETVPQGGEEETGSSMGNQNQGEAWSWDYDSYLRFNSDTKGFIMSEGTPIQYPIMQGPDNDYYLHHLANNIVSDNGAIFIDYKIDLGLEARNCIIYGHNMRDGSMFANLIQYTSEEYCRLHPYMDIYVGYKHYRYYVFAAYTTESTADTYTIRFQDDNDFLDYINRSRGKSLYTPDVGEITANDKIVTLSTCTSDGNEKYRFVVQLVRREEVAE